MSQRRPAIFWCLAFGEMTFSGSSFCNAKENNFSLCEYSRIFGGWGPDHAGGLRPQWVRKELHATAWPCLAQCFSGEPGGFEDVEETPWFCHQKNDKPSALLLFLLVFLLFWPKQSFTQGIARLHVFVRNDEAHLRAEESSPALRTKCA